jgi:VWFA-related protein
MPVRARTSAVFPWSIWPAVPTITLLIPLLVSPGVVEAQETAPLFRSGVSNVRIDVQVTQDNNLVTDLTKSDFAVFDEGHSHPLVYFGRESEPLSLLLLIDISGSMREYIEQVAAVARESLRHLRLQDRVAVMIFAKEARVRLEWTDSHGQVAEELKQGVYDDTLGAGTNINDALLAAAKYIDSTVEPTVRRAVLILTDNRGLNYRSPDAAVIEAMNAAESVVNAIVVGRGQRPEPVSGGTYRNPDFTTPDVFLISEQTGGEAVKADKAGRAFNTMIERIRTRYALHYATPSGATAGSFRRVEVKLTPEARQRYPRAQLRHRPGYRVRE